MRHSQADSCQTEENRSVFCAAPAVARRRFAAVALTLVAVAFASAALWLDPPRAATGTEADERKGKAIDPLFAETVPASNETGLNFIVDEQKVLGWISGVKDFAGEAVTVARRAAAGSADDAGGRVETIVVQQGNTFTWSYRVDRPTEVTFSIGPMTRSTRVEPTGTTEPSVFFVVDRTAYRPGQTLHFAGFLRRPDRTGEFAPLPGEEVEVQLTSRSKKTVAARLKLTSDDFGRITGDYSFLEADALDTYDLSIPGYKGSAELTLAEFRKSKVKLTIDGQLDGQTLKLTFRALDFLDKPVPGSNVRYRLQVVRQTGGEEAHALDADEFVYRDDAAFGRMEEGDLSDDDRLLRDAGFPIFPSGVRSGAQVVAQREGDVVMGTSGEVEHAVELEPEWITGDCRAVVQGVLLDYNGHEQRATQSIAIGTQSKDYRLELALRNHYVAADADFTVEVRPLDEASRPVDASASIVAMRLEPSAAAVHGPFAHRFGYYNSILPANPNFGPMGYNGFFRQRNALSPGGPRGAWHRPARAGADAPQRTTVTATVVNGGRATLKLSEPGAYKLVCFAQLADGRKLQHEIGCIVHEKKELPSLHLKLNRDELQTGGMLTGEIQSRFRDARLLLTVRDSSGIRFWKTIAMQGSVHRLEERLPAGLRYGCHVDVQYVDGKRLHMDGRFIRVEPVDRIVKVDVKHDEIYNPGDEVSLALSVNRREPVDLVVSVYDQSLLGIAPDKSADVRNFYLADERVRHSVTQERLRRLLGSVTVRELIERAEKLLKEDESLAGTPEGHELQTTVSYYRNSQRVYQSHLHVLFQLAGIAAHPDIWQQRHYGWNWYWQADRDREAASPARLVDALEQGANQWKLHFRFAGETLAYFSWHELHRNQLLQLGQMNNGVIYRGGYGAPSVRGDARFSVSGNGIFSNMVSGNSSISGQAFISHLPAGAPVELISADDPGVSVRRDFSDSAFWKANVRTDERGMAAVKFKLPDSLTNWRVVVTAVSPRMHVGQVSQTFRTYKPVMVWPMLPRVFTEGDTVEVYAAVHNRSKEPQQMDVSLKVENGSLRSPAKVRVEVPAESQVPVYWTFQPGKAGHTQLLMTAKCAAGSDASLKRLPVSRLAAEQLVTASGLCRNTATLLVPSQVSLENSQLELTLVPSLADDLVQSLDYLVEYPHGCVEQTMSRFLPAIRVAQTLKRANIRHPELEKKLPGVVEAGVKRLLELQQPDGGWGWHGGSRTHEMMTPYALYGLLQAEKAGYDIPNEHAVERGLARLEAFINAMNENQAADRVYCMSVYSLRKELKDEWWTFIKQQAAADRLSDYALALSLEMLTDREAEAETAGDLRVALDRRAKRADGAAYWTTAGFSRWGDDRFEITAAVLKSLVAHNSDDALIPEILSFFAQTKRGNRWNSTKDTAMIVFAMCDYLATQDFKVGEEQTLSLTVNGGERRDVRLPSGGVAKLVIPGAQLAHGENVIRFERPVPGAMYRAVVRYWQHGRDIAPLEHGLTVARNFYLLDAQGKRVRILKQDDTIPRGSYIESEVNVAHKLGADMQYVLVSNPKPSTCEILPATDSRFNQNSTAYALREDKTYGVAWHHEQTGARIENRCVLHAELAGDYTVPPAQVELMYATDVRGHSASFRFRVEEGNKVAVRR